MMQKSAPAQRFVVVGLTTWSLPRPCRYAASTFQAKLLIPFEYLQIVVNANFTIRFTVIAAEQIGHLLLIAH